ncbi:AAR2-domain-containing protein [Hesseltinella vesiculosa]|uniref:AAR2-domain-containing protein n=1 Tax=Hesseltinella vesiculosa TaxID=101127 RepID=A0A1X2GFQ0_9FUNG|nr:AAR2-domain-containing protein [Hesseltinella vesiculosa]
MDQDTANRLFEVGGKLLFLNAPPRLEFGIDYNAWTVGPQFKGVKMIPPGLHFIYYSSTSKEGIQGLRTGFFKYFEQAEVTAIAQRHCPHPLFSPRLLFASGTLALKIYIREFDIHMGPYPLEPPTYYQRWQHLTNYITPGLVLRILPNNGKVSHLPSTTPDLDLKHTRQRQALEKEQGMEFTPFDLRQSFPAGATGDQITRWSMDKSWLTQDLLHRVYHDDYRLLLGEFQLAFVCLLMAQNFSGFQQWKQFVHLLCSCQDLLLKKPDLFMAFLDTLQFQLEECPVDFFRDILSENNFLASMLKNLRRTLPPNETQLSRRFDSLKRFIEKRFDWELDHSDEEEDDEDAPVVVDLDDM